MTGVMKPLLKSSVRVLGALLLVALGVSLVGGGWLAWQDHSYATALSQAHERVDGRNEAEIQARLSKVPTYLCEKRRGMPVTEALTRIVHATDEVGIAAAQRTADSVKKIEAPKRWAEFHSLTTTRRETLVEMAVAYDAANARAIEVASAAQPKTELAVVEALATDRKYRDLEATAKGLRGNVRDLEERMRKAAPDHRVPSDSITRELRRTTEEGTLRLGAMYELVSRPETIPTEAPASSDTPGGATTPPAATGGYGATPAVPAPGSGEPRC